MTQMWNWLKAEQQNFEQREKKTNIEQGDDMNCWKTRCEEVQIILWMRAWRSKVTDSWG